MTPPALLTDAELEERERTYPLNLRLTTRRMNEKAFAAWTELSTIQEPALLARLREAERLLKAWQEGYTLMIDTSEYFARVAGERE